jgi:hypothetical protein
MDISKVVQSFHGKVTITIGKSISRQCFSISNKIFFDILKTYLSKNGWFVSKQYLCKQYYYKNNCLETIIEKGSSTVLGLEVPIKQTVSLYEKKDEVIKKFRGTYFDIFCQHYNRVEMDTPEELSRDVYNEVTSEVSIFKKSGTNIEIIMSVCKEDPPVFTVQLVLDGYNDLDKEAMEFVTEIIELAMCKYKKTDRTVASNFTPL